MMATPLTFADMDRCVECSLLYCSPEFVGKLEESHARTVAALKDIFALMEEGYLVRNMHDDSEPGWAMRQLPYVRRLARAAAILAVAQELGKT